MGSSLKSRVVVPLLKQFLPDIQREAAPMLNNVLAGIIRQTEDDLHLGEDHAAIIVQQQNGKIYLCVTTMTEHNRLSRVVERYTVDELVNMFMSKFIQKDKGHY